MEGLSRFHCPSVSLRLNALLKRRRGVLWAALALTLMVHFMVTQWRGMQKETRVSKPLTTQFIKRQPRLTKPLELKKRPRPRRRIMQRKMVAVKAKIDRRQAPSTIKSLEVVRSLARPDVSVLRSVIVSGTALEPKALAQAIESTKEAANQVDMSLEMMDIEALDTGKYHALGIVDPMDKRNIRGFLHLAFAYPASAVLHSTWGAENLFVRCPKAISRLALFMDGHTDIRTDYKGTLTFDASEMLKLPWICITPHRMYNYRLASGEAEVLGRYLLTGGFVFGDCGTTNVIPGEVLPRSPEYPALLRLLEEGLLTQGLKYNREVGIEDLSSDHPILHCYYDFSAPPVGHGGALTRSGRRWYAEPWRFLHYEDRTLALLGDQFYLQVWAYVSTNSPPPWSADPSRPFQFGVNTIIFALTQEGSITNRVMDNVRY